MEAVFGANFHLQECNLTVEDCVIIGPNVTILGGGHRIERTDIPIGCQGSYPQTDMTIGYGSWIGRGVTILGKVNRIGKHVVIGAGSVVTKDIPDYEVWSGNPARFIRKRHNQE